MQSRAYPINAVSCADVFPTTDGTYYTDAILASKGVYELEWEEKP